MTAATDERLTTRETSARLRVSERTVVRMIQTGDLPAVRIGKWRWLIPATAVEQMLGGSRAA